MKTLILNGSPNAERGNTEIFIRHFQSGMQNPCEVRYIAREKPSGLAAYLEQFDQVLIFMPLYIHAMPGIVRKLLEQVRPQSGTEKSLGYVIQAGFMESATAAWAVQSLELLTKRLGYRYLGTVVRCNSAPIHMLPQRLYRKLFHKLAQLGQYYAAHSCFDPQIVAWLAEPHRISPRNVRLYSNPLLVRLNKVFIHRMQKKNGCYEQRLDQPYLSK